MSRLVENIGLTMRRLTDAAAQRSIDSARDGPRGKNVFATRSSGVDGAAHITDVLQDTLSMIDITPMNLLGYWLTGSRGQA